jgi:hypothetical protein
LIDLMQALAWQEADVLIESCLEWTQSDDVELAIEAIDYISYDASAKALPALIDLALEGPIPVRAAAVVALAGWPNSREVLDVVIQSSGSTDPSIQLAAVKALETVPFEEAWRHLEDMSRSTTLSSCPKAAAAAAISTPEALPESWARRFEACGAIRSWTWKGHVTPPGTMDSIRCWRGPDISGDPEFYLRIPANTLVQIYDRFESQDETWIELIDRDCWIPFGLITEGIAEEKPEAAVMEAEMDITVEQLVSPIVQGLLEADVLEVFDPEQDVVGVVLTLEAHDRDAIERVLELFEPGTTPLHEALVCAVRRCVESGDLDDELLERARSLVGDKKEAAP